MRRNPFYVRCYAKLDGDQWVAVCIDLGLAAQADTCDEVKAKLDVQINDYVFEALTVDRAHAADLLRRQAPLKNRLEYHLFWLMQKITPEVKKREYAFQELLAVPA
jgi:hypothetical protein